MYVQPDRFIGFSESGYAEKHGRYYCGNGARNIFLRQVMDAHYKACLYAGLNITGSNAETLPG